MITETIYPIRCIKSNVMIRFDGLPPEVMRAMCTPMHLVIPSNPSNPSRGALYLGSLSATMDKSILLEKNITHLVQVLDVPWLPLSEKDGFECYRIDILDIPSADLKCHLEGACKDIDKALRSGQNVLVHCQQASYRSLLGSRTEHTDTVRDRAYLAVLQS